MLRWLLLGQAARAALGGRGAQNPRFTVINENQIKLSKVLGTYYFFEAMDLHPRIKREKKWYESVYLTLVINY